MQPTTFLYFNFGNNFTNHTMGYFSFLTFKKFAPVNSRFVMYTDKPDYYKFLLPEIELRIFTDEQLKEWKGQFDFLWRIKIKAMMDSAGRDPGHLIYLDSDTFAKSDLTPMIQKLEQGTSLMHVRESLLSEDKAKNKIRMWGQVENKTFGGMQVTKDSAMWNAGVVAISEKNKNELINKALSSTDEMCAAHVEQWLIEQFSLSQALASTGKLEACDQWITHYWGHKKEFIQKIDLWLSQALQCQLSKEDLIRSINIEEWLQIMKPKPKKSFWQKIFN